MRSFGLAPTLRGGADETRSWSWTESADTTGGEDDDMQS